MSNYKNSILRELGIRDPKKPIQMDSSKKRRGLKENTPSRERMMSPTAIPTPVIAVAVRGSNTGGLPSGRDNDIALAKLGGYAPIEPEKENSVIADKTPENSVIDGPQPIATSGEVAPVSPEEDHPHQTQLDAGEPPQAVTGASTDSDDSLTLKSAVPKEIDIDVTDTGDQLPQNDSEETVKSSDGSGNPNKETGFGVPGMNEERVPTKYLQEVIKSLEQKAIKGQLNKKETAVFRCITEVLQRRGLGLEQKIFGKKTLLETAGVDVVKKKSLNERELPHDAVVAAWQEDKSSGEYIGINDNGDAYYQGKLIVPAKREKEQLHPPYQSKTDSLPAKWKETGRTLGPDWELIKTWCKEHNYHPNIWSVNDHGNLSLYTVNGKYLGGLV